MLYRFHEQGNVLTHWGRMTHICVSNRAIIWTNAGILLTGPLGTNFNEILIEIHIFSLISRTCIWKYRLENGGHFVPGIIHRVYSRTLVVFPHRTSNNLSHVDNTMTSCHGNAFRVITHFVRGIPLTKASHAELWRCLGDSHGRSYLYAKTDRSAYTLEVKITSVLLRKILTTCVIPVFRNDRKL